MRLSRFISLFEIAEMSHADALAVFRRLGVDASRMDPAQIKAAHRGLIRKVHPDAGGNSEDAKLLNSAFDTLKKGNPGPSGGRQAGYSRYSGQTSQPQRTAPEVWAQAGHSGGMPNSSSIYRTDYQDVNFIKKTLWEMNGKKTDQEWTVQSFDGNYFRRIFTAYANPTLFPEMAEAMHTWTTKGGSPYPCEMIFASRRSQPQFKYLIWYNEQTFEAGGGDQKWMFDLDMIDDPDLSQDANTRVFIRKVRERLTQNS